MKHLLGASAIVAADLALKERAEKDPKVNKYHNYGLPFGFLKERPMVVILLPLLLLCVLIGKWVELMVDGCRPCDEQSRSTDDNKGLLTALTFIVAGGASNEIDRLKKGYVVDYLNNKKGKHKNFFFNLGDVSVLIGLGVYIIWTVTSRRK